jgi:hypothetical protein
MHDGALRRLASLQAAHNKLITGAKVARLVFPDGRTVEYGAGEMKKLKQEIEQLTRSPQGCSMRRARGSCAGPMRISGVTMPYARTRRRSGAGRFLPTGAPLCGVSMPTGFARRWSSEQPQLLDQTGCAKFESSEIEHPVAVTSFTRSAAMWRVARRHLRLQPKKSTQTELVFLLVRPQGTRSSTFFTTADSSEKHSQGKKRIEQAT